MKNYIISIIGTAVFCSAVHILTPQNWVKYIKIITGLIILSVITAPLTYILNINLFSDFSIEESNLDQNLHITAVADEFKNRIENDIEKRIEDEFSHSADVEIKVSFNENNEITGISHIKIITDANKSRVNSRMCEIYGVTSEQVDIYETQKL